MKKTTQDRLWAILSKDERDELRKAYATPPQNHYSEGYDNARNFYFGHHNLTSDEEPPELLFVERKRIQELYSDYQRARATKSTLDKAVFDGRLDMLDDLFDNKCQPDTEPSVQVEPKFKVGDKVKIIDYDRSMSSLFYYKGKICTIVGIKENGMYKLELVNNSDKSYRVNEYDRADDFLKTIQWAESQLEPYTEPEYRNLSQNIANCDKSEDKQLKDIWKKKELNLSKLLKGCEGETVFLVDEGEKIVDAITDKEIIFRDKNTIGTIHFKGESLLIQPTGFAYAYPSKEAFLAHPLDARKAWDEWWSERTPKRWRAKQGETYWYISRGLTPHECTADANSDFDRINYENGNMFPAEELAYQAAEAVRKTLEEFHAKHTEQ